VTGGGCFDFDQEIKNRKCLDFKKKIKNDQGLFFLRSLTKKNMFFMKRTTNQAVVPPGCKTRKEDKQR
jgi:hypothetical protein